jgi:hypothetical protein
LKRVAQISALAVKGIMYGRYATREKARFPLLRLSTKIAKAAPMTMEKTAVPTEKKSVL